MDPVLVKLAMSAGGILVKAITTDGYELVRKAVLKLWRRHEPERAEMIEQTLATTQAELAEAPEAEAAQVAQEFDAEWLAYFRALLRNHPEAADDVRAMVEELTPLIAGDAGQNARDITQTAHVRGGISIQAGNSVGNVDIGKFEQR